MGSLLKKLSRLFLLLFIARVMAYTDVEIAQNLTNPIVQELMTFPFQGNYNSQMNVDKTGHETFVNLQPIVPIKLNKRWYLISRTIFPISDEVNSVPFSGNQFGLSDTLQSFFLSPSKTYKEDLVWGIGPVIQIPTGTSSLLGTGKWAVGPTPVILKMMGPWTLGFLGRQLWSFAGSLNRPSINQSYFQPILAYTTQNAWSYTLNCEGNYYWNSHLFSIPVHFMVAKTFTLAKQSISIQGGPRYWLVPENVGPRGWGGRLEVTFVFPT